MKNDIDFWGAKIEDFTTTKIFDKTEYVTFKNIDVNMYETIKKKAKIMPDKIGIVDTFGKSYTYKNLLNLTDDFSNYLYNEKSIRKDSNIGLILYNSIEFIIAYLAAQRLGAVTVPFPTKYSKNELVSLIQKSDCDLVIVEERFTDLSEIDNNLKLTIITCNTKKEAYSFENLKSHPIEELKHEITESDLALIIFTSGTTSASKGVMIKNYNLQHAVSAYQYTLSVDENDSTILSIPVYNVTGLIATLSLFLKVGGTIRIHKFFDAKLLIEEIVQHNITFFHGSPTVFMLMLQEKNKFTAIPSLRLLACGSGNMPSNKVKELKEWIPHVEFRTVYGLSETSSPATIFPNDASNDELLGASGIPIPGLKVRIVDEDMNALSPNKKGEIILKGTNVISSYYDLKTDLITKDNWLKTGDIGYMNKNGYLYVVDRKKDMINRGGEKVYCIDIENAISEIEGVDEVAAIAKQDNLYGEVPIAVVTLKEGSSNDEESIQKDLYISLAKYEIPEEIIILEKIPKTSNGKIDKKYIRKMVEKERKKFGS